MELLIVVMLVVAAAVLLVLRLVRTLRRPPGKPDGCDCSSTDCGGCTSPHKPPDPGTGPRPQGS